MVRRQVHQFDRDPVAIHELHQAFHELRAGTGDLGTIIEFDVQSLDAPMNRFSLVPPVLEAIGDEVAGLFRMAEEEPRLLDRHRAAIQLQHAQRNQQGVGRQVVIEGLHGFGAAGLTATGELADFDFRLGIEGDSQRVRFVRSPGTGGLDVLEDRVGFGNFFSGRVFKTRRSR